MTATRLEARSRHFPRPPSTTSTSTLSPDNRSLDSSTHHDEVERQIIYEARQADAFELYEEMATPSAQLLGTTNYSPSQPSPATASAPVTPVTPSPSSNAPSPRVQSLHDGALPALRTSLMLGKYSDLTIIHKQRTWQAHKVIVCSKSPVLEAMIEGLEALEEPILDISQYGSSAAAECLLDYIYTSVYPEPPSDIAPESILNLHVQIFILASTFQIHGLQDYAVERFQHDLISLVTEHELFFNLVRRVYKGTTHEHPGLRLVVVEMAIAEMQNMLADEGVKWAFLRLTSDVTEFQTEIYEGLMKGMAVKVMPVQPVLCESCGPMDESERGFVLVTCERCKQDRQVMIG